MARTLEAESSRFVTSRNLILSGERVNRQETVQVDEIVNEGLVIDQQHAEGIAASILGDRGQITPVTLVARLEGGQLVYRIVDGFHRVEAKRMIQVGSGEKQSLMAVVLYGSDDEELYDLRVLAVNSVKSVKFVRMVDWMRRSFETTKWQNKDIASRVETKRITLSQVFTMAGGDNPGTSFGLEEAEVRELKFWAKKKAKQWDKPLSTLALELRTADLADPSLVQMVRMGGGGRDGEGVLSRTRLDAIVKHLPNEYPAQRLFVTMALEKDLLSSEIDYLGSRYVQAREEGDQETMRKVLETPEAILAPLQQTPAIDTEEGKAKKRAKRFRRTKRDAQAGITVRDLLVLERYRISDVLKILIDSALEKEERRVSLLTIPTREPLMLDRDKGELSLEGNIVLLSEAESRAMQTFYVLEGIRVPFRLLSFLNRGYGKIDFGRVVKSLKEKLKKLSNEAATELIIERNGDCGWLIK